MSTRNFRSMLEAKWAEGKFVCVGLDPDLKKIPECMKAGGDYESVINFIAEIVSETDDLVCAYKPNAAFFEAIGAGFEVLGTVINAIHDLAPDVPIIYDAKRADIGNTNNGYVESAFDLLAADAITVHPYLGQEALGPFLERKDKGVIVLCRTSNKGAGEFQDRLTEIGAEEAKTLGLQRWENVLSYLSQDGPASFPVTRRFVKQYQLVAGRVAHSWNVNNNCLLVVGATYPGELAEVRQIVGDLPILIPGIGAQGGDVENTVKAGKDSQGRGMIINSSRGILYASSGDDFAKAARRETIKLNDEIRKHL